MGDIALDTMIEMRESHPDLFEVSVLRREWEAMAFKYTPDGQDGTRRAVCLLPDLAKKTDLGRQALYPGPTGRAIWGYPEKWLMAHHTGYWKATSARKLQNECLGRRGIRFSVLTRRKTRRLR